MARILIAGYCSLPAPDRTGVQLGHLLKALNRDHAVDVLCVRRADQAYVERQGTARLLRVPVSDGDALARIETFRRALGRQLEGAEYDAIVVRDGAAGVPALAMRDYLQAALVFDAARSPLGEVPPLDLELARQIAHDDDLCLRQADLVLAPTEASRQYLATRSRPERVHTVPLGVDVDLFDWDEPRAGPVRILCLGSMGAGRDIVTLLKAMQQVVAVTDAVLVLAGQLSPEARVVLESDIDSLHLRGRVELLGEVEHRLVPQLIASATVCVAPTAAELSPRPTTVFPSKLLEYLACRRAVVAPRTGTVTLLVRDRQHALLFNPGDGDSLAKCMLRLIHERELRERLARAGYEMVRRDHTASATRRRLRHAFEWLAGQPPWAERWREAAARGGEPASPLGGSAGEGVADSLAIAEHARISNGLGPVPSFVDEHTFTDGAGAEPEDVTMVEAGRRADSSTYITTEAELEPGVRGDDWVVGESSGPLAVPHGISGEPHGARPGGSGHVAERSRFVAGEVEVGSGAGEKRRNARDTEPVFQAMSPVLGAATKPVPAVEAAPQRSRRTTAGRKPPPVPGSLSGGGAKINKSDTARRSPSKKRPD